ncbi:MAG TPA: CtsR family transcriptional regulator [Firmicutes bacterium]|nr:CtsR family transcriptional regulator [Bacillota bacterium]
MANLCDLIEQYILSLLEEASGSVELQRKELAREFGCVPSQITYVLETRFTTERGYVVESRRGGGGHIRIVRLRSSGLPGALREWYREIGNSLSRVSAFHWVDRLVWEGLISDREALLLRSALEHCDDLGDEGTAAMVRAAWLKGILKGLWRMRSGE